MTADGNLLRATANCKSYVEQYANQAWNECLEQDSPFQSWRLYLLDLLRRDAATDGSLRYAHPQRLHRRLAEYASGNKLACLTGSLLSALNTWLAQQLAPELDAPACEVNAAAEFGGANWVIEPDRPGPLRRAHQGNPYQPRDNQHISHTVGGFHPQLQIRAATSGGVHLTRVSLPKETRDHLGRRVDAGLIRLAVSSLSRCVDLERCDLNFPGTEEPHRFRVASIANESAESQALARVLAECQRQQVHILVLPELRISPGLLRSLQEGLAAQAHAILREGRGLLLVAAGSWHVSSGGRWTNRCTVLNHCGNVLWEHDKLSQFHRPPDGGNGPVRMEDIERGTRLEYCDTALGRITAAICAGFFAENIQQPLRELKADYYLVPAMSPKVDLLRGFAQDLTRNHWAVTAVANCGAKAHRDAAGALHSDAASFIHTPIQHDTYRAPLTAADHTLCVVEIPLPV